MKTILIYSLAGVLILSGLALINSAIRNRSTKEVMLGKTLPMDGKGGKIHLVYLGIMLILFGCIALVKIS